MTPIPTAPVNTPTPELPLTVQFVGVPTLQTPGPGGRAAPLNMPPPLPLTVHLFSVVVPEFDTPKPELPLTVQSVSVVLAVPRPTKESVATPPPLPVAELPL